MNTKVLKVFVPLAALAAGIWVVVDAQNDDDKGVSNQENQPINAAPKFELFSPQSKTKGLDFSSLTDPSVGWQLRVDRLRRLDPDTLGEADIDALYQLLDHRPSRQDMRSWWIVVNEVMEQLRRHGLHREKLTPALLAVIRDETAHEVIRDYAVQHLGQWINPREDYPSAPYEEDSNNVSEVEAAFVDLITDPTLGHTSIPGTTLMVLVDLKNGSLHEKSSALPGNLTSWLAKTITGDTQFSKLTRVSALNAVGLLRLQSMHQEVRKLAEDQAADPSLRLNAIASLGFLGKAEDRAFLEGFTQSNSKYRFAAQTALKNLSKTSR